MMGFCPYDGEECHHDGYCEDCPHSKKEGEIGKIAAILIDISKSLAIIAAEKQDHEKSDDKETLDYYTAVCTSCGKPGPIGDYCIWCGEKGTCFEGGEAE